MQIFVRSYMSSELRWQVFFLCVNSVSPACNFRSNRIFSVPPKCATRCHRLCNQKTILPLVLHFFWSSSTQWILSSTSITILSSALCWISRTKPSRRIPGKTFLEIDVKGGERDHIKAQGGEKVSRIPDIIKREREISRGREYSRIPDAWCSRGEIPHVLLGERHVHMYSFELSSICIFQLWFSVPYLLPISHVRFRGSKTPKGKKSVKFIAYLYSWGHVEFNVVPCTHSLHVIPVLVFLWFLLFALASGCTCVI